MNREIMKERMGEAEAGGWRLEAGGVSHFINF